MVESNNQLDWLQNFYKLCPIIYFMTPEKQYSHNWSKYQNNQGVIDGFPFEEGFPSGGVFANHTKVYELITRDGSRVQAKVDYSTQYRAEGIKWFTLDRETLDQSVVAAWREL